MKALVLLVVLASAGAAALPFDETWYLLRGRANMKIQNYRAAIEAFQRLVEKNPAHREGMRSLGLAYEKQGLTDRAVEQYDRYLERFPDDAEIARRQAGFLEWSRYAYRQDDAIRYYRIALDAKDDPVLRRKLARLLARDKDRLDEALAEYRKLLSASPKDTALRAEYRKLLAWDKRHLPEAIEEQEAVVRAHPSDRDAQRQLARLYAQTPGHEREATAIYGKLVDERSPAALRVEYADLLAAHSDTRDEALAQYRRALEQEPGSTRTRLKYARLLGGKKDTSAEAARQFDRVADREPGNAQAHAGAAHAYAWSGDTDRAYRAGRLAEQYGGRSVELTTLNRDLRRGREPSVGGSFLFLSQPDGAGALDGYVMAMHGQMDWGPYVTARAEGGPEIFATSKETVASPFVAATVQARLGRAHRVEGRLGYHPYRASTEGLVASALYGYRPGGWSLSAGFRRELRYDSFAALVEGAARSNLFEVELGVGLKPLTLSFAPFLGWISGVSVPGNFTGGASARADLALVGEGTFRLGLAYTASLAHYGRPSAAYHSPSFFLAQTPKLWVRWGGEQHELRLEGGPSWQYETAFRLGADVDLGYRWRIAKDVAWDLQGGYLKVATAYTRLQVGTTLSYLF